MCNAHNIKESTYSSRVRKGWDVGRILTTPTGARNKKRCVDHLGNTYESQKDMYDAYNISAGAVVFRLNNGWSLKDSLETPTKKDTFSQHCFDHLGNEFKSISEMCRYHNIKRTTFNARMKQGLSLEDVLTKEKVLPSKVCTDHKGNTFKSINQMCVFYGINQRTLNARLKKGLPLEEALTAPIKAKEVECTDHTGRVFSSMQEMCAYYNISPQTLNNRRQKHEWSLEQMLTTPVRKQKRSLRQRRKKHV